MKKRTALGLLSLLLCLLLLLSPCLGVVSYAAYSDSDNLIDNQDLNSWNISANGSYDITYSEDYNSNRIDLPRGSGDPSSYYNYYFYELENLNLKDEYEFTFKYKSINMGKYQVKACLFLISPGGSIVNDPATICDIQSPSQGGDFQTYTCHFVPENLVDVTSGYRLAIGFYFHGANLVSTAINTCWIKDIELKNLDDTSGFFNNILQALYLIVLKIEDLGGSIVSGISSAISNIQGWLNNVKDGIVSKLQDVKSGITSALDTVKTGIQNTLNSVKSAITDKLEAIKTSINQTFTNVIDGLKSYLRSLFIPSDGYFAGKVNELKLWAQEHLGFLYTGASMFANFIQEISDMFVSDSYQFSLPDIDLTVAGERIQLELSDSVEGVNSVMNDSVFSGLYTLYKTLLGMAIGFALFKYSESVLNKILSN